MAWEEGLEVSQAGPEWAGVEAGGSPVGGQQVGAATPALKSESRAGQSKETIPGVMLKMQGFPGLHQQQETRTEQGSRWESRESRMQGRDEQGIGYRAMSWPLARIPEESRKVQRPPGPRPAAAGAGLTEGRTPCRLETLKPYK